MFRRFLFLQPYNTEQSQSKFVLKLRGVNKKKIILTENLRSSFFFSSEMEVDTSNDNQELDLVWEEIKSSFGLEKDKDYVLKQLSDYAVDILISQNLYIGVLDYLQAEVEKRLRVNVAPCFWKHFHQKCTLDDNETSAKRFHTGNNKL